MYKQGDIIVVPFPFSDLSNVKQRPVLVLSKNLDNDHSEDVITCGITSNVKESKYSVFIENKNLIEGQIPKPSRIKVDKLFTINQGVINKKVARIDKETFETSRFAFAQSPDFSP